MLEDAKMVINAHLIANFALAHQLAAKKFAARARAIEHDHPAPQFGGFWDDIRAYATGSILSSAFAIEAFINECFLLPDGPLRAQTANFDDAFWGDARNVSWRTRVMRLLRLQRAQAGIVWLQPLAKYDRALKLLRHDKLKKIARDECRHAEALIGLRNMLVHFKPLYDPPRDTQQELERKLRACAFPLSRYHGVESDFVLQCMSAGCADWAVKSSADLVGVFAQRTGINVAAASAFR